jgi:hypothetical protein
VRASNLGKRATTLLGILRISTSNNSGKLPKTGGKREHHGQVQSEAKQITCRPGTNGGSQPALKLSFDRPGPDLSRPDRPPKQPRMVGTFLKVHAA